MFKLSRSSLFLRWLNLSLICALLWAPLAGIAQAAPMSKVAETAPPLEAPPEEEGGPLPWTAETLAGLAQGDPAPPPPDADEAWRADLEALELARQQGPEAVLALRETLRGPALDLALPEILAAHRQLIQQAPPRSATAPISEAEELAALQAQAALDAESRVRALALHADPAENAPAENNAPAAPRQSQAPAVDLTVGDGCTYATIAAAITAANPGDTLLIEGGVTFTENLIVPITLTLQGGYGGCASASSARTTIDGNGSGSVVVIDATLSVTLTQLNLTNGSTGLEGGGLRFARGDGTGVLNLSNVHIYGNTGFWGGGLWVGVDAEVTGENVHIYDNTATAFGGGVRLWGGRATFSDSNIYGNIAPRGAGVYATQESGYASLLALPTSTDIYNNTALTGDGFGGGVYMREGEISLADSSDIYSNNAIAGGGAYLITSTLTLAGVYSEIMLNTATGNGGGVYAQGSTINLDDSAELYYNSTNGNGGGAYLDNSTLWGDKAVIHYNTANGYGGGVYAINGSLLDMDLGGYTCAGPRCSQLSYNTASSFYGGGVYARDSEVDLHQTFVENNTGSLGGAIYAWRDPSAATRAVYAYNSLFAGNDGGTVDGIRLWAGIGETTRMVGSHNTLAYNPSAGDGVALAMAGGGTFNLTLSNSIVWGHATSINDLAQTVTCSDIEGGYTGANNLNVNPLFVSPGDGNFHLRGDSPVIDRCATGDARDFDNEVRPVIYSRPTTPYDMGADEASPRVGINGAACAYGRIQDAVNAANPGDVIQAATDTFFETVDIAKTLTLSGGYDVDCTTYITGTTIVDGNGSADSVFDITAGVVTLRNLQITGGNAIGGGVDASSSAHVTLDNLRITGNTGTYGAGLYVGTTAVVTLTNNTRIENNAATTAGGGARVWGKLVQTSWAGGITNNTAPNGGGVSVPGGVLEMRPGHVGNNQATAANGRGGGIHVFDGGVVTAMSSSNVYRNNAYDGGGIYADNAHVTLGAVIHSNTAANNGGGVYLTNHSALYAANTRIGDDQVAGRHNEATAGGGIYAQNSHVEFNGRIFSNRAETQGGGIFAASSMITLTNAHVGGAGANQANDITGGIFGAGLYLSDTHALLSNTVVASNTFSSGAGWGGGIVAWEGSVVTLTNNSRVESHYAPNVWMFGGAGAGLLVYSSTVTLDNSQVLSNTADYFGGAIYMVETSTLNVLNGSVIAHNHVITGSGGAIAAVGAPDINISDATLRNNSAATDGGAIYLNAGTLDFTGGWTLRENTTGGNGGAVAVMGNAEANFRAGGYSLVYFNRALSGHGGMLYRANTATADTKLYATSGHEMYIYANSASGNGGALYAQGGGKFDIYGAVNFDRNRAASGGAIYLTGGAQVWLDDYVNIAPQLWDNWADTGSGGAIYAQDSPNVRCDGAIFGQADDGNHALVSGGALYLSGSTFRADNCIFQENEARQHGGAIAAYTSTLSIYATYPAPSLAVQRDGGERELLSPAAPAASPCNPLTGQCSVFSGNTADSDVNNTGLGGAIYSNNSILRISHTYLYRNNAYYGGAIHQTGANAVGEVANSLIYSNTVGFALGAGIRSEGGLFTVTHVTLANNVNGAGYSQSNTEGFVTNSIAWGNGAGGFWLSSGTIITNCNLDQSNIAGPDVNPLFIAPGAGENYRLGSGSPALDACATGLPLDLDNKARPIGDQYDMGAYEGMGESRIYLPLVLRNSP